MRKIKLTIEYDGSNYCGWQRQPNGVSIQETVEKAVRAMTGEEGMLVGASRTDAGVHALGQVAHFTTVTTIPADGFMRGLSSMLPQDIVIIGAEDMPEGFHAMKNARGKWYRYALHTAMQPSALHHNRAWHVPQRLNIAAMREAASAFQGKHDFAAFQAAGSSVTHAVRTLHEIIIKQVKEIHLEAISLLPPLSPGIVLDFKGDGFVRHMVRNIVGTIVDVGLGKIDAADIPAIIEGRTRNKAGVCAPACGLYLVEVYY